MRGGGGGGGVPQDKLIAHNSIMLCRSELRTFPYTTCVRGVHVGLLVLGVEPEDGAPFWIKFCAFIIYAGSLYRLPKYLDLPMQ